MNNLFLAPSNMPKWVGDSFPIIQGIIIGLISLLSIIMIVAILVSPPDAGTGTNAITGASESYYTKNRNKNNLGRIRNQENTIKRVGNHQLFFCIMVKIKILQEIGWSLFSSDFIGWMAPTPIILMVTANIS